LKEGGQKSRGVALIVGNQLIPVLINVNGREVTGWVGIKQYSMVMMEESNSLSSFPFTTKVDCKLNHSCEDFHQSLQ